jgi:hypothetical protein
MTYSMLDGIKWTASSRDDVDIEFTSASMAQMLRHGTGYDTLYISGRFTERRSGARFDFSQNFVVLRRNEHGQFVPDRLPTSALFAGGYFAGSGVKAPA